MTSKQKILIVDDKRENLFALRHILCELEVEVVEAMSGNEALAATLHHDFAVAILDVQMPEMTGYELAEYLRGSSKTRKMPIIFLTAVYGDEQHVFRGYEAGGVDFITKPYSPQILLSKLRILLELDRNQRELTRHRDHLEALVAERTAELLLAKEEWERTFESIGDIVTILSPELRIVRVNKQAVQALSTPREKLLGRFCYEVFHGGSEPCAGCPAMDTCRDGGEHTAEIEHHGLGKVFQVSASPVFADDKQLIHIIHLAKDITARKEMEIRLQQSQKLEAIGTLAGGIAHDFNNILTPILGYSEMIQMELGPGHPVTEKLVAVMEAGLRAKDLVQQILTFSRQKENELLPLALHLIVREALKLLRSSIPTSIEIRQDIDVNSGLVLADGTQLHQIIMNLGTNAYHAMRGSGGVLTMSLHSTEVGPDDLNAHGLELAPGVYLLLEVTDTGCGMDRQTIGKIFDPYFTTKKQGEGTGLGLSVVHGIVKEYGGHIEVQSELGKGSTFRVYLPRIVSAPVEALPVLAQPLPRGTEKILVVDDDLTILELNTKILEGLGYTVTGFSASLEALRQFEGAPQDFDLVLTDMTMPDMNGADLSLRMHAIRPDIPIILCSGFSELIDDDTVTAVGIQAFLQKPFSRQKVAAAIRRVLDAEAHDAQ